MSKQKKKDALGHWERRLVKLVQAHGAMIEEHRDGEALYFVEGFGQVGGKAPADLIRKGVLVPSGDGLFSDDSQTYVIGGTHEA